MTDRPFWQHKRLAEMTRDEWEALCDGCGKCCLEKLEDVATGEIIHTDVACRLLDVHSCRCSRYATRHRWVANCETLDAVNVHRFHWLPSSCAYRLLAEGRELPWWHPLVSGDPDLVHVVGASVRGRAVPEKRAGPLEHHIVTWSG
ncbi:MAG: YcgN family cysteine cluster protein [Rhodospirillales bacterium]